MVGGGAGGGAADAVADGVDAWLGGASTIPGVMIVDPAGAAAAFTMGSEVAGTEAEVCARPASR